jgi:polysaccharide export outer membrane protein
MMRVLPILLFVAIACGPQVNNSRVNLPPPVESTTLGAGDVFILEIVGEKDLPLEYRVASDGSVELPYVAQLKVAGLEPQQISQLIRQQLIERQILTNPSVIVSVKEYNSKRISVLGQVQKPGSFPLAPGMTLVEAISQAGGLNAIANRDRVNITRRHKGGTQTAQVSIAAITDGESPDVPLQAGDQIYVHERVF